MLQNRIEQLEQLLEENHEIIVHIKDSVLELTANAEGQPVLLPFHMPNGSWMLPPESRPSFYAVSTQDCHFALAARGPHQPDLQVSGERGQRRGGGGGGGVPGRGHGPARLPLSPPPDAGRVCAAALRQPGRGCVEARL